MIDMRSVIAANRFGLGARPGELSAIGSSPEDWLHAQVEGPAATPAAVAVLPNSREILAEFQRNRRDLAEARGDSGDDRAPPDAGRRLRETLRSAYRDQATARCAAAIDTDLPFRERLTHFWSNHFAVSADKPPVTGLAGAMENEAIRPHVAGSFPDMLQAVIRHPAMLLYLDNQASIGPDSRGARFLASRGRKADINENLGREILELHTLGVDGGYTQADVVALSKILTGWSVGGGRGRARAGIPGTFHFREAIHEPGPQNLLGRTYQQDGQAQGEAALQDLARHPSTARRVATKLVRHFVADTPPATIVDRAAAAYLATDGDLPTTYKALITSPETWQVPHSKYKTPADYVISSLRALGVKPDAPRQLIGSFILLGQPPYRPGSPAGWPDTAADWDGADGLLRRIEWAEALARRAGAAPDPLTVALNILGPALGRHTRTAIRRAESRAQGLTLLLASPEFMRR